MSIDSEVHDACFVDERSCETSTFGCCFDGVTAAMGANYEGCPSECERSVYGCCPDMKEPALGPNYFGCEPLCAYTMYGCCKDNKTHAHGPNYKGCQEKPVTYPFEGMWKSFVSYFTKVSRF